jgi:hypothetical protein
MLDNPHDDVKFPVGKSDDYIYFGGDINGHNVVIATIPSGHSHGVAAMASLARDIKAKFSGRPVRAAGWGCERAS